MNSGKYNITNELNHLKEMQSSGDDSKENAMELINQICICIEALGRQMPQSDRNGFRLSNMICEMKDDATKIHEASEDFDGAKTIADTWITEFYDLCLACGCEM